MVRERPIAYHVLGWPVHTHIWKQYSWFKGENSADGDTSIEIRFPLGHALLRASDPVLINASLEMNETYME